MALHLIVSDPAYATVNELANMIACAANPHLTRLDMDLPDAEQRALLTILKDEMQARIDAVGSPLMEYAEHVIAGRGGTVNEIVTG